MVWLSGSDDESKAIAALENDSDRAASIVAATIVEGRLERAIKCRLHPRKSETEEFFRPSGPLGSFAIKIKLAYLMGIFGDQAYRDLITLKEIRNSFAHHLDILDF